MIPVVVDCNVVMAACGWRSEPYFCLVAMARRQVRAFITERIEEECRRVARRMESDRIFTRSPWPMLNWYLAACERVQASPVGKRRSRDASDDEYLACALAAKANLVVSRDPDLLALEKPFGISIVTPRQLLSRLSFDG